MTSELLEANIALSVYQHTVPPGLKVLWSGAVDNIQFDIFKRGDMVFVAFAGTNEVKDCIRHLWVRRKRVGSGVKIHRGWLADFKKVLPVLYAMLREHVDSPDVQVTWIGHSYGGALCQIACYFWAPEIGPERNHIRTYGSPRVGNSKFCEELALRVKSWYRIEVKGDPVTMVPLAIRYQHGGTRIMLPFHKNPHSMKGYLEALDQ